MKTPLFFLCIFLFFFSVSVFAQDAQNETFISVQIRPRAEYRNGALFPREDGENPATFITNRAKLSLGYERNRMQIRMSAQHVGVWGQDPQIERNGRFMLNEAWARLDFGRHCYIKLGRQGLVYDDERILGGLDWNVSGRFHDALILGYDGKVHKVNTILAFNQNEERISGGNFYAPGGQPYKAMQTLWYKYESESPFSISALIMNLGQEAGTNGDADTKYFQTFGANAIYSKNRLRLAGTFYYQTGKTTENTKISAWMASLNVGYQIAEKWNIGIGSDYLTGEKENSSKHNAFNTLYGTNHKFYGTMDYFYASNFINRYNPGLWDNYARVTFIPWNRFKFMLDYHYFNIAEKITVNNEKVSKGLGSEIDFQFDFDVMKDVKLSCGYSFMLGTNTMDIVKGGNHNNWQDWGWISLNINPNIFFAKW